VHGPFATIEDAQAAVDAWRKQYNADRPHQSLAMAFPRLGSLPRPVTRLACGYPPNWPDAHRLPPLMLIPCQMPGRLPLPKGTLTTMARKTGPWNWTGWSRHRAICGWPGSRSGWGPR
jgi:hypothetical protein